jgi:hypothetical protein
MNPYGKYLAGRDPIEVLTDTPARLRALTAGLTPQQLASRPSPGKWSIRDIVQHLADCEIMFVARCRWIAYDDNPTLIAFDQDKWAEGRMCENEPVDESLDRFALLRQSQLRLFRSLPDAAWDRTGRHTERGEQRLRDYPPLCAGHDINHLQQIEALRQADDR